MSINRSLFIGLTGMNANSQALNVIGDNIANMNTVGFKGSRSNFQEMLGQSMMGSGGTSSMGGGVGMASVEKMFQQGALLGTGVSTDMAIAGDGFFAVEGEVDGTTGTFFSRDGRFHRDKDGFLVGAASGLKLLGYVAGADGNIGASVGPMQINDAPIPAKATTEIDFAMNLSADAKPNAEVEEMDAWDPQKPGETSQSSTSIKVYDSQGLEHEVTVYFEKTDAGWNYHALTDASSVEAAPDGSSFVEISSGALTFDENGKLTGGAEAAGVKFKPAGGAAELDLSLDFTGTKQSGTESHQIDTEQNGSKSGTFQSLQIEKDGTILGTFSNGQQRTLGQVALARVKDPSGLRSASGGLMAGSIDAGTVILGKAGTAGLGNIYSGNLEQSTVDLAAEFTQMIMAQRGYQANSRSITTADQVIQEAVNLKR